MSKAMGVPVEQLQQAIANLTMLKRGASIFDRAKVVAFAASDNARMITGTVLNSTGGAAAD
jgi:hypothetical protein